MRIQRDIISVLVKKYLSPKGYVRRCLVRPARYGFLRGFDVITKRKHLALSDSELVHQPIFIIGAPRTGSTILYQALTNYFDFLFIDNLACKFYQSLSCGIWLSQRRFADRPHGNFWSRHGNTTICGGHAPSECGQFWYRWFPRDRHFVTASDVGDEVPSAIRREISAIINRYEKPFIFKNLNVGMRLQILGKAFPDAKYIFIRRDPRFVIRSIIMARRATNTAPDEWWSVMPPNWRELVRLPELEMCAGQVYYIEKQIQEDLGYFPAKNIFELHHRDLSASTINKLKIWLNVELRPGGELPSFQKDNLAELKMDEFRKLEAARGRFPFDNGLFG